MHLKHFSPTALIFFGFITLVKSQDCPTTPSPLPKAASFPKLSTLPDPFLYLDGRTRVLSVAEWHACRQPEILRMLQEYQYDYYPDHSLENVTATKSSNTVSVTVTAGGKTGKFNAAVNLPSGVSAAAPVPVVIAIGGIDTNLYVRNGIAVVTFDYTSVAPDSNSKTGAFWSLYNGRDIGIPEIFCPVSTSYQFFLSQTQVRSQPGHGASIALLMLSYSGSQK